MWFQSTSPLQPTSDDNTPSNDAVKISYSTNGVHWKAGRGAYELGGGTDDPPLGTVLKPNTDSWWNFDTYGVRCGSVLTPTLTPTLRVEQGVHIMYYSGGNFEVPEGGVRGVRGKIGIAISQDGESWGRVEGDDPSGASIVSSDLERGWVSHPDVVYVVDETTMGRKGEIKGTFWMHYVEGEVGGSGEYGRRVNTAACADGFNWVESKRGVIEPTQGTEDEGGIGSINVFKSMKWDEDHNIWKNELGYTMYYSAIDSKGKLSICEAHNESPTLTSEWVKKGKVELPHENVGGPNVIRMPDGEERIYFHVEKDGRRWIEGAERKGGVWKPIHKSISLPE